MLVLLCLVIYLKKIWMNIPVCLNLFLKYLEKVH